MLERLAQANAPAECIPAMRYPRALGDTYFKGGAPEYGSGAFVEARARRHENPSRGALALAGAEIMSVLAGSVI